MPPLRPSLDHHFCISEKLEGFPPVALDISKEGTLGPAEGEEGHGRGNTQVDPHHAGHCAVFKFPCCLSIRRIQTSSISIFAMLNQFQTLIQVLHMNDRGNRSEYLLPGNGHIRMNVVENRGTDIKA